MGDIADWLYLAVCLYALFIILIASWDIDQQRPK